MAHPYNEHRGHKHERARVHDIAGRHEDVRHYARGGKVHDDEAEDRELIRKEVKKTALKQDGGRVKARADKAPRRARGGHVKHKGKGSTHVNVIVAPGGGQRPPMMPPVGAAPVMPPRPPVAPPPVSPTAAAGPAPGVGGMPPPMLPPRKRGGRVFQKGDVVRKHPKAGPLEVDRHRQGFGTSTLHGHKHRNMGGKVHDDFGAADMNAATPQKNRDDWGDSRMKGYKDGGVVGKKSEADRRGLTGIGDRTPIQHSGNKQDTQNIGRGPVITKATGGPIYSNGREGQDMGPNLHAGSNSGVGRRNKNALARREHWEA